LTVSGTAAGELPRRTVFQTG